MTFNKNWFCLILFLLYLLNLFYHIVSICFRLMILVLYGGDYVILIFVHSEDNQINASMFLVDVIKLYMIGTSSRADPFDNNVTKYYEKLNLESQLKIRYLLTQQRLSGFAKSSKSIATILILFYWQTVDLCIALKYPLFMMFDTYPTFGNRLQYP